MEFTHTVPVPVTSDAFNLADWIFAMTDKEYMACAKGHHAMGIIGAEKRTGIINLEQIAGTLIVQHYETRLAQPKHVTFVSEASEGFLLHTVPFKMKVHWDMQLLPGSDAKSSLQCTIGFDAPGWATAAGVLNRSNHFVHQHLIEETGGFARDIASKTVPGSART